MSQRVLVVDNDRHTFEMISHLFHKYQPYSRLIFCENAIDALEVFKEKPFDLVLADCVMPEMNGPSFIAEIRKANREIPIILMYEGGKSDEHCCEPSLKDKHGATSVVAKENFSHLYINFMAEEESEIDSWDQSGTRGER